VNIEIELAPMLLFTILCRNDDCLSLLVCCSMPIQYFFKTAKATQADILFVKATIIDARRAYLTHNIIHNYSTSSFLNSVAIKN
jgi:hypothetical protein